MDLYSSMNADFQSKRRRSDACIRTFVHQEHDIVYCSSSSSLSSQNSGGDDGNNLKSVISRCLSVPTSMHRRSSGSKGNPTTAIRPRHLLLRGNGRASMPIIRDNVRASPSRAAKRSSNRNEAWDCSAIQMLRDSCTTIFSHDLKRTKPSLKNASSEKQMLRDSCATIFSHNLKRTTPSTENASSEKQVDGEHRSAASSKEALKNIRASLPSICTSSPRILGPRARMSSFDSPSNTVEELLKPKMTAQPKRLVPCLKKCTKRTRSNTKIRNVSFAPILLPGCICTSSLDLEEIDTLWYNKSDCDQFLTDATVRASLTDCTMQYVAPNERTYNSSTGLTAPHVLGEYLSSPEEVIGVEHLLTVQKTARESLRCHHTKALLREQQRQKKREGGGYDLHLLAKRLGSTSAISTHMAQERASYIILMD